MLEITYVHETQPRPATQYVFKENISQGNIFSQNMQLIQTLKATIWIHRVNCSSSALKLQANDV